MSDEILATMATKVPKSVRDDLVALAKARNVTPSALLRALIERELAGAPDGEQPGDVEAAVLAELTEHGTDVTQARAQVAVNLARRMDRVPTSGAQNAAQLRMLLAEISPFGKTGLSLDSLHWLRLAVQFKRRYWRLVDKNGAQFDLVDVPDADRDAFMAAVSG